MIASLVVARFGSPRHRASVLWTAYSLGGLAIALLALAPDVRVVWVLSALAIGLILYGDLLWVAMMQELVLKEMLGRASPLVDLFAFALGPLGILAGGAAAAAIGTRAALVLSGAVSAGSACS